MAGGGLMQLVAYGAQDIYLTGNPQVTFFKVTYRRHTNFSIESVQQQFTGSADFGGTAVCTVSRMGDLIWKVYLQADLPALAKSGGTVAWVRKVGVYLIQSAAIDIGGQTVDTQYSEWMHIWNELTLDTGKVDGYNVMVGNTTTLTTQAASIASARIYVPLEFWFCRNIGLALPLISLQYHEVRITIVFRSAASLYITDDGGALTSSTPALTNCNLWIDYIYLDTDERRKFAKGAHEYLIEQVQRTEESVSATSYTAKPNFNHPCKFMVFVVQLDSAVATNVNRWIDFTDGSPAYLGGHNLTDAQLKLNNHDRFAVRQNNYFNLVQPYQHFPNIPSTGVYVYSFAINPHEHQPSGTVNFSRIDNVQLTLTLASSSASKLRIYVMDFNVARLISGLFGLAYSN